MHIWRRALADVSDISDLSDSSDVSDLPQPALVIPATVRGLMATLFFVLGAFPAAAELRLTIGPDVVLALPAISHEITVTIENQGASPVQIENRFALRVWPHGAEDFVALGGFGEDTALMFDGMKTTTLRPGESLEFLVPEATAPWKCDTEMWSPGTYRVQLLSPEAASNEITLVVENPEGEDAAVWDWVSQRKEYGCSAVWSGLVDYVWEHQRASSYAFYTPPYPHHGTPEERIAVFERSISVDPGNPLADRYRLMVAESHQDLAGRLVSERRLEEALVHADAARELLEELMESRELYVKSEATRLLGRNYTWEGIQRSDRIRHGPPFFEIEPVCFSETERGFEVMFDGYRTKETLELPIGPANKFTPAPFDRGQPTHFRRGYYLLSWRLQHEGPQKQLVWHINGERIMLSAKEAEKNEWPPCPDPSEDPEQWWIELDNR